MKNVQKLIFCVLSMLMIACSSTKYVPEGDYLLNQEHIKVHSKQVTAETLAPFLRQTPNQRIFSVFRLQLGVYDLSGKDTTKWINRWLRRAGEKPVIYDSLAMEVSRQEMKKELQNEGYQHAIVDVITKKKKKKINVTYKITLGSPYIISDFNVSPKLDSLIAIHVPPKGGFDYSIQKGMNFNVNDLDQERTDLSTYLRNNGFYNITREVFHYRADTTLGKNKAIVELGLRRDLLANDTLLQKTFSRKKIGSITFETMQPMPGTNTSSAQKDTVAYEGYTMIYHGTPFLRIKPLVFNTFVTPGGYYSEKDVRSTFAALNALPPVKYVNLQFKEQSDSMLSCNVQITPDKLQSFTNDIEGTNSGGNFGVAEDFSYQHRNLFRGAELLKFHARASYESLGSLSNIFSYNATELAGDVSLKYPTFLFPFLSHDFKRSLHGSTTFSLGYNYQVRPEFVRNLANAGVKYIWSLSRNTTFTFDLLDLSYIYLPRIDSSFRATYLSNSSPLRFSYENQMILKTGFSMQHIEQGMNNAHLSYVNWRWDVSEAGNLLDGMLHLFKATPDPDGVYRLFHIRFAQYIKGDYDISYNQYLSPDNRMVYHFNAGLVCPLGNADVVPFEERYYAGGADGVRGWSSYTLGPGGYPYSSGVIDFVNHTGDIKLQGNIEYRFKLFWQFDGALFYDAGNIWTIRNYSTQPNGVFNFSTFYKQIAMSYGLGVRFNLNYFVLRMDLGHQLYNPAFRGNSAWIPALKGFSKRSALFFAIGYPF
ncbi:BamA/TamA family outer membrane protein [Microbacter margulisiae]|uniref:Outer membrane protein assembly factor BamA n=1 Tax=Microbacter margulisiae TaxID=1350067 RepID=A0A7W5DR71_9PORP|nr:BamA/TamA family outer membrane protein [Microbacter margulisiae]MBB3187526.1 outer membrane protein assembly factor BamA [Microbacter margulisiae]